MRKSLMVFAVVMVATVVMLPHRMAAAREEDRYAQAAEPSSGEVLCLPEERLQEPGSCLVAGPAQVLTQQAKNGVPLAVPVFPVAPLPSGLASIPFQYALASDKSVPLYGSLDAAIARQAQRVLPPGKIYVSYSQRVERESGVYYRIQTGEWISGESVLSRVGYSTEPRGVLITGIPRYTFGWTIDVVETRVAPGLKSKLTGRKIAIYTLLWVYETQRVENADWVRIGREEWAEKRLVGRVIHNPVPPKGVDNGRWIEINLYDQTVSVYENSRLIYATLIASGIKQMATRPGLFQITKKLPAENMTGSFEADRSDYYYLESVPWTMYFDGARALHGVYWRTSFGRQLSHGCVNLSVADARWLFDWAKPGEWVFAWDEREQKP